MSEKTLLKVASCRTVAIDKADMDAVLAKYRELGIHQTEEQILQAIRRMAQREAAKYGKKPLPGDWAISFWEAFRKIILGYTPDDAIALLGFDSRNV
jgi:hypothetical protein